MSNCTWGHCTGLTKDVVSYEWSSWVEYERKDTDRIICNINGVLGRMPLEELRDLVFELLPKSTVMLDFDNASKMKTDSDIRDYLIKTYDLRDASDILYEKYGITDDEIAFIESMIKPME